MFLLLLVLVFFIFVFCVEFGFIILFLLLDFIDGKNKLIKLKNSQKMKTVMN